MFAVYPARAQLFARLLAVMQDVGCEEQEAEPLDVGLQALIRGLGTAFPLFVWGCLVVCPTGVDRSRPTILSRIPHRGLCLQRFTAAVWFVTCTGQAAFTGGTSCPIAQRNAAISRAIAVVATVLSLPRARSRW
jgi:hypothetical protein